MFPCKAIWSEIPWDVEALCPLQVPELYFDDYTLECLKRASDVFQKHLLDEMKIMQERLVAKLNLWGFHSCSFLVDEKRSVETQDYLLKTSWPRLLYIYIILYLPGFQERARGVNSAKDLLGGKNWRNLLGYALKFMPTTEIGSMLMDAIPNPKTRRMVENAITRGLWDQMDELQPVVEELEEEMEAYNAPKQQHVRVQQMARCSSLSRI